MAARFSTTASGSSEETPRMTETLQRLTLRDWLTELDREYLRDYICSGGSAVKFVDGSSAQIETVRARVADMAEAGSYYYAHLDPGQRDAAGKRPDLHQINRFFFAVTSKVDWNVWAAQQARRYLESRGIRLMEGRALGDLEQIAEDNGYDPQDLINQYQRELATPQIKDPRLAIEFRTAITALGRALLIPDAVTPTT